MVIVDSSVLIDYLADRSTPQTEWIEKNSGLQRIGVTTLILTEILQGIREDDRFAETLDALDHFAVFEAGGRDLAVASARNYRALRQRGITIRNTIDCLTATFCIAERHELLHNDRDFDPFEEHLHLEVFHPGALS
jgi:predicted nucleic acid-binding protein